MGKNSMDSLINVLEGGEGSGHYGHTGIIGHQGGSQKKGTIPIGTKVTVKSSYSIHSGDWGNILDFDGDKTYLVQMLGDKNTVVELDRDELTVQKEKKLEKARTWGFVKNQNYKPGYFKKQDGRLEEIPKIMKNRQAGYLYEAAGDIFRELHKSQDWLDDGYVDEKVQRIKRYKRDLLSDIDADLVEEWRKGFMKFEYDTPATIAFKDLVNGMADKNLKQVDDALARIEKDYTQEAVNGSVNESVNTTDEMPYRTEPVEEDTVTEVDIEGLEDEVAGMFLLNWARPERLYEIYGADLSKVPDYVPAGKRKSWAAMWNAIYMKYGDEGKAFAITNAKYTKKTQEVVEGGPGSGNFGHAGRPGLVGGSASRGEGPEHYYRGPYSVEYTPAGKILTDEMKYALREIREGTETKPKNAKEAITMIRLITQSTEHYIDNIDYQLIHMQGTWDANGKYIHGIKMADAIAQREIWTDIAREGITRVLGDGTEFDMGELKFDGPNPQLIAEAAEKATHFVSALIPKTLGDAIVANKMFPSRDKVAPVWYKRPKNACYWYQLNQIDIAHKQATSGVHELGHWLESHIPYGAKMGMAWQLIAKSAGMKRSSEYGLKVYQHQDRESTEALSTTLEGIFATPAQVVKNEPHRIEYLYNLLHSQDPGSGMQTPVGGYKINTNPIKLTGVPARTRGLD